MSDQDSGYSQEFQDVLVRAINQILDEPDTLSGKNADDIELILRNRLHCLEQGLPLTTEIVKLLNSTERSSEWLKSFLERNGVDYTLLMNGVNGDQFIEIPGTLKKYVCKIVDPSHFEWYQVWRGQSVPLCPIDNNLLEPE